MVEVRVCSPRQRILYPLGGRNQIGDQTLVDVHETFVFTQVAAAVAQVEHAPDLRPQAQCVWQNLRTCLRSSEA